MVQAKTARDMVLSNPRPPLDCLVYSKTVPRLSPQLCPAAAASDLSDRLLLLRPHTVVAPARAQLDEAHRGIRARGATRPVGQAAAAQHAAHAARNKRAHHCGAHRWIRARGVTRPVGQAAAAQHAARNKRAHHCGGTSACTTGRGAPRDKLERHCAHWGTARTMNVQPRDKGKTLCRSELTNSACSIATVASMVCHRQKVLLSLFHIHSNCTIRPTDLGACCNHHSRYVCRQAGTRFAARRALAGRGPVSSWR